MPLHTARRSILNSVLCLTTYLLFIVNWQWGGLRFTSTRLNVLAFVLALLLPLLSLRGLSRFPSSRVLTGVLWVTWPVALTSALLALLVLFFGLPTWAANDAGTEITHTVTVDGPPVRVYRTSTCGLIDSRFDDIVIQQERPLFSDLIWVTRLHKRVWPNGIRLTRVNGHTIRCTFLPGFYNESAEVVTLKTVR